MLAFAVLSGATGSPRAEIVNSAVATGSYEGATIRSAPAETAIAVEPAAPAMSVTISAVAVDDDGRPGISPGDTLVLDLSVENRGDAGIKDVKINIDLTQGGRAFSPRDIVQTGDDGGQPDMLDRGETWHYRARYTIDSANLESAAPVRVAATASGAGAGTPVTGFGLKLAELPPLQGIERGLISIAQTAGVSRAGVGDEALYVITVANRSDKDLSVRLVATLGRGVALVDGSAMVDGQPVEPSQVDNSLVFGVFTAPAGGALTAAYSGAVGAEAGDGAVVTSASIVDPATGVALLPPSDAAVLTGARPPADCSAVSISAFDDANRDGTQQPDEAGLSGVRLSVGRVGPLTTDPSGRFVSPCVAISRLAGMELRFTLDKSTLPHGYFLTTQNPLDTKVERGKAAEAAFGAAEARVVRIDINEAAFARNDATPDEAMKAGITQLISVLGREPSILRLTYYAHREDPDLVQRRLDGVRQTILDYWVASGGQYELEVDARVVQADDG